MMLRRVDVDSKLLHLCDQEILGAEISLAAAGYSFVGLSPLMQSLPSRPDTKGVTLLDPAINSFGYIVPDVTLTEQNEIVLIESNGSNAGFTSLPRELEAERVRHILQMLVAKSCLSGVVLFAYKEHTYHLAEVIARANVIRNCLGAILPCKLQRASDKVGDQGVTLILDTIANISQFCRIENDTLLFRGSNVLLACNSNLLFHLNDAPERSVVDAMCVAKVASQFHDGCCLSVALDKVLQQKMAIGTGIRPLKTATAFTLDEAVKAVRAFGKMGLAAVAKVNSKSGASGVEFFPAAHVDEEHIRHRLELLTSLSSTSPKASIADPIGIFEFVESRHMQLCDGPHLWDIRVQVLIRPGSILAIPSIIRICPEPFHGEFTRGSVVSNLSSRDPSLQFVRLAGDTDCCQRIELSENRLESILQAVATWAQNAWKYGHKKSGAKY